MLESLGYLLDGFATAGIWYNFLFCLLGVVFGMLVGVLPGLGPSAGTAMLLPLTYGLGAESAIIMLAGIYYGAMYGGTIAGVITIIVWSHVKKIRFAATLDAASSGLILGQVIGRWANFVNREAFGRETDIFCRMGLTTPDGTTYYVHPTFLYESLWNLVGFIIIDRYWYRKDHRKYDGQIFIFYVFWYGAGRAWVEGLRTDSLYIPGTNIRTSQLVAAVSAVIALALLLINIKRPHKPTYVSVQAAAEASAAQAAEDIQETTNTGKTEEENDV